jgi:hypothetical protein
MVNFVEESGCLFDMKTLALMATASFCGGVRHKRYSGQQDSAPKKIKCMKNIVGFLLVSFLFISCQPKIKPEDISKINGYWEIEKVVFDQGEDKEYGSNESYDYFQIDKDNTGFRKKVMPQLDGTFMVNDTYENVKIRFEDDKAFLDYTTPYAKWSEELIAVSDKELVLMNAEKKEYHYKKAGALNILEDGKKTK